MSIAYCESHHFDELTKLQLECFPDEVPIDLLTFENLINRNNIIVSQDSSDQIFGYLFFTTYGHYAVLNQIGVNSKYRGRNTGSRLIEHLSAILLSKNISAIHLYVDVNNEIATKLYKKFGFSIHKESFQYRIFLDQISNQYATTILERATPQDFRYLSLKYDITQELLEFLINYPQTILYKVISNSGDTCGFFQYNSRSQEIIPIFLDHPDLIRDVCVSLAGMLTSPTTIRILFDGLAIAKTLDTYPWTSIDYELLKMVKIIDS